MRRLRVRRGFVACLAAAVGASLSGGIVLMTSSGATSPSDGVVTGTVSVTGIPAGIPYQTGLLACPSSTPTGRLCAHPHLVTVGAGTPFRLPLPPGSWRIRSFYSVLPYGGLFLTGGRIFGVQSSNTVQDNPTVAYSMPGTARGTVSVANVPTNVIITKYSVLACPQWTPFTGGKPPLTCVSEFSGASTSGSSATNTATPASGSSQAPANRAPYQITTLPPGNWLLYPRYGTVFGSPVSRAGTLVAVKAGGSTLRDLTTTFGAPTHGAVQGSVFINDAPGGFAGATGVSACTSPSGSSTTCQNVSFADSVGDYQLGLSPGHWWLKPFYVDFRGTGASVPGTPVAVTVAAGVVTFLNLSINYNR